ncbi:PadR family transcriptional regulator [Acidipropionibacterium virtanenii]|uniref:Transcriptional regulator YqjI n=1 Tax=Acidipropionibacterium virtanenii TaxID=2057246 RepID=A0A344UX47_9ACTN|nr:PadR family transcriptional regulator [Acidipropionibacterium virtanenii]AXE39845.1 Transcriptional regulator YqjI [Acidipropionibacterium virtanenii]
MSQHPDDRPGPCHGPHHSRDRNYPPSPWDVVDAFRDLAAGRSERHPHPGPRMGRGDVRAAILELLAEEPMHGYQIIREIESRSHGVWKPSAGSVYPTLQMLADEGLVEVEESEGRKTYRLTDSGRDEAGEDRERPAPWETAAAQTVGRAVELPKAASKLAQAVAQVVRGGSPEQIDAAVRVVDDARRKLYSILAEE